jgi:hypothetical protein
MDSSPAPIKDSIGAVLDPIAEKAMSAAILILSPQMEF